MKNVMRLLLLLILGATAFADQELNLYSESCTVFNTNPATATGYASWHNTYGSPSCAVAGQKGGGNDCSYPYVQYNFRNKTCAYTNTYAPVSSIVVAGTCGTILTSPTFYLYGSGAAAI